MTDDLIDDIYEVFGEDTKLQNLKAISPLIVGGVEFQLINGDNIDIYDIDEDKIKGIIDLVDGNKPNDFFVDKTKDESSDDFFVDKTENQILREVEDYIKTL